MTTATNSHLVESRMASAPKLPVGRPPTKAECWARYHHLYEGVKEPDVLVREVHTTWAWTYAAAVNGKGWDKHPDWVEGDVVIREAVPTTLFFPGDNFVSRVDELWAIAQKRKDT